MASLTLHNYLRKGPSRNIYCPPDLLDNEDCTGTVRPGQWRNDVQATSMTPLDMPRSGHNASAKAKQTRETFKDYFNNEGSVSWQWDISL